MPEIKDHYNNFDESKHYSRVMYRDGYALQGAELNEMQSISAARDRRLADALFADGDIVSDAGIVVDSATGAVTCLAGRIYIKGEVRDVDSATFTIPTTGTVTIGVRLVERIISELEDPALYNPAVGSRGEGEAGAWRLKVTAAWGLSADAAGGEFYPVHTIDDGMPRAREVPPSLDSFNKSLARYDRDSTGGGTYVSAGMLVRVAENAGDMQVYTVAEGRCRVNGYGVELPTSRRISYAAVPDLRFVDTEVIEADGSEKQRITVAHPPIREIVALRVTLQKNVSLVHGAYAGAADALPDTSVMSLVRVRQGDTVYEAGKDYKKNGDKVDWSPSGAEPDPGSTYEVTYTYLDKSLTPQDADFDGFSVSGAVAGTGIMVSYRQALPRIDRLCISADGVFSWVQGVASENNALAPAVPDAMLSLASVRQNWRGPGTVVNDGVRVVPWSDMEALANRVDYVMREVARQRLEADVATREAGARVGLFVDPLRDDSMRDQGIPQSAAVVDGILTLPVTAAVYPLSADVQAPRARNYTPRVLLSQPYKTGGMLVNPYQAFAPMPADVELSPAVDRWTETRTDWTSTVTRRITNFVYAPGAWDHGRTYTNTATRTETVGAATSDLEFLRQIDVAFTVKGFGPGEALKDISFDGVTVPAKEEGLKADSTGTLVGTFTIPAGIPAGAKTVTFTGMGGTAGSATFVGQGTLTATTLRQVQTITSTVIDPLAQTFILDADTQLAGIDLWFRAKGAGGVRVQIREVSGGYPTRTVLSEAIVPEEKIVVSSGRHTRVLFDAPVPLAASTDYAVVVLCNDAVTELAIAELGQFDSTVQQWVSSQPYSVGVLLSSSNAITWTAHQTRDLTFRLLEAVYADGAASIDLGAATVSTAATDLVLLSLAETPTSQTRVEYALELPGGTALTVAEGQPVRLAEPVSGGIAVTARLMGDGRGSPVLWPGSQLLAGTVQNSADYYSRSIPATGATRTVLIYDAVIPSGSSVTPEIQIDGGAWEIMAAGDTVNQGNNLVEFKFTHALSGANLVKVRLTLAGTAVARPQVSNIRLMAVA